MILNFVCALLGALLLGMAETQSVTLNQVLSSAAPCSGLFTRDSFLGCTSKRNSGDNVGDLRYFSTSANFTTALSQGSFKGAWVITSETWCTMTKTTLEALNSLATSLIVIQESDTPTRCLTPSRYDDNWNKYGSSSALASLSFPVMKLARQDSITLLSLIQAPGTERTRVEFYMGQSDGSVDAEYCLSINKCSPLGGLSVWSVVHSPPLSVGDSAILLAANMDSTAFFHDLSFGFHASGGDIATLMAATSALSTLPVTRTRIISAVFQGEAFGRIGSKRFVSDVSSGVCRSYTSPANQTCADPPNFSLEFTKFQGLDSITSVIALSNVLRVDLDINKTSLFVLNSSSSLSAQVGARLAFELAQLGASSSSIIANDVSSLPPTALTSFAEQSSWIQSNATAGVVLAGYSFDISEANPHFETEDDTMDLSQLDAYTDKATLLATALARALYYVASNGTVTLVTADRTLMASLLLCFGANFATNCSLAQSALNATLTDLNNTVANSAVTAQTPYAQATNQPLFSYTSVYSPLSSITGRVKLRELFIRNVLASLSVDGTISDVPVQDCTSDVDCRDDWEGVGNCPRIASNASVACVSGRCTCTTTFYHEAWSTGLSFDPNAGLFTVLNSTTSDLVYTEPFWTPAVFIVFSGSSSADVAASLIVGLLLIALTHILVSRAKRYQDATGKFKIA